MLYKHIIAISGRATVSSIFGISLISEGRKDFKCSLAYLDLIPFAALPLLNFVSIFICPSNLLFFKNMHFAIFIFYFFRIFLTHTDLFFVPLPNKKSKKMKYLFHKKKSFSSFCENAFAQGKTQKKNVTFHKFKQKCFQRRAKVVTFYNVKAKDPHDKGVMVRLTVCSGKIVNRTVFYGFPFLTTVSIIVP